jgi:hypothetical protein
MKMKLILTSFNASLLHDTSHKSIEQFQGTLLTSPLCIHTKDAYKKLHLGYINIILTYINITGNISTEHLIFITEYLWKLSA